MPNRPTFDPQPRRAPHPGQPLTIHLREPPADAFIQRHRHSWGQLVCPRRGSMRMSVSHTAWIVPVFRALWIPPGVDHEVAMLGTVEFHVVYVDPAASPLPLTECRVMEVSALMRDLMEELALQPAPEERRTRLMMELLVEEIREAAPLPLALPLPSDRRLKSLCDAVMEDPASARTLADWAASVGASERTLARLFRDELHIGFGAWRRRVRLARAVDLIAQGTPLVEVAIELGYSSAPAFSTMFRNALGVAPSRFAPSGIRPAGGAGAGRRG